MKKAIQLVISKKTEHTTYIAKSSGVSLGSFKAAYK